MKTKFKLFFILSFFALFMFNSCQDEIIEITPQDEEQTFVANSTMAKLMSSTSAKDGSADNIIDHASCLTVELPVTVVVNGVEIIVDSEEDFQVIESIFDEYQDDNDHLEIEYPITIILSNYDEIVINNNDELEAFIAECSGEDQPDDDIECIDFQYPLTFSIYNLDFQVIDVITVHNDEELHRFIRNLADGLLASLNFPVTLIYADGSSVEVNSNVELERVISEARNTCDEDDNNDYGDDDFTKERLDHLLVSCPWVVHEMRRNSTDLTNDYVEYAMFFHEDGTVKVRARNGDMLTGTWTTRVTDHGAKLTLDFDTLVDFTLEWFVYDIGEGKIKLFTEGGNRIILVRNCDLNTEPTIEAVENILQQCFWRIARLHIDGDVFEEQYIGIPLKFGADGVVKLRINGEFVTGHWDIIQANIGLVLQMSFDNRPELNLYWHIDVLSPNTVHLVNENSEMILKKHCYDGDNDLTYIDAILLTGQWEIALYEEGDMNLTDEYSIYSIDFLENGALKVLNPNNVVVDYGAWLAYRNEGLFLGLNFGLDSTFNEFNYRWRITHITEGRIELTDFSSTGTVERTLVLERIQ